MTKKQMEERIAQLEKRVMELQSQLLTLSLRGGYTFVPITVPNTDPSHVPAPNTIPSWPPYTPYIGDPPGGNTTITCGTQSSAIKAQAHN